MTEEEYIPNPEDADEIVLLFNESIYPQLVTRDFGHAAPCCICGYLTNGRKNGKPRCKMCYNNLVEPA